MPASRSAAVLTSASDRTHDRQVAHVPGSVADDRALAGDAHRAPDIVGELGLVFGKKPDLALSAMLVEHAHGLGQPQHEGAEPRAVRMLVTQPDQHTVADGIARKARSLRRSGGGQQQGEENDGSYHPNFHLFWNLPQRAPATRQPPASVSCVTLSEAQVAARSPKPIMTGRGPLAYEPWVSPLDLASR